MFLIQHGFQKGTKVTDCISAGTADGVVWSPADETEANLRAAMDDPVLANVVLAVDPQMYVAALSAPSLKKLGDYGYFRSNLQARHFTPQLTLDTVRDVLDFQASLPITVALSPTVAVDSSRGRWAQVASSLADAALADWSARQTVTPLFLSVALTQSLLTNEIETNAVLNDLTSFEADGFYILFEIKADLDPAVEAEILERALWIAYSLGDLNEFPVWVGYTGLSGYPFLAAGAEAVAAGWWQKLQYWSPDHWLGSPGGRQPRPRLVTDTLLNSILIDSELDAIFRADRTLYDEIVSGVGPLSVRYRQSPPSNASAPSRDDLAAQLFAVCHELSSRVTKAESVSDRIRRVLDDIAAADVRYRRIRAAGIGLDPQSSQRRLTVWSTALQGLASRIGITP